MRPGDAGPDGGDVDFGRCPLRREEPDVALDGEIRPRVERRGFDLTFPHGPHDGESRIPLLPLRLGLLVRGRSAPEILPRQSVLLLREFQRVWLPLPGVELRLQSRDLLLQGFDLGIAGRGCIEVLHLPLHGAVGLGGPTHGVVGGCRFPGRSEPVVQKREGVVAEGHHAFLLLPLGPELLGGLALIREGRLCLSVRHGRVDSLLLLLRLLSAAQDSSDEKDAEDRGCGTRDPYLLFPPPFECGRRILLRPRFIRLCHIRFKVLTVEFRYVRFRCRAFPGRDTIAMRPS